MFAHKISMMEISPLDSDIVARPFCFDLVINTSFYITNLFYGKKKDFFQLQHEILEGNPGFFFFSMNWGKISYSLVPSSHFRNKIFFPIVSMGLFVSKKLNKAATLPFFFSICADKVSGFKIVIWVNVAYEVAALFTFTCCFVVVIIEEASIFFFVHVEIKINSLKTKFAFDLLHVLLSSLDQIWAKHTLFVNWKDWTIRVLFSSAEVYHIGAQFVNGTVLRWYLFPNETSTPRAQSWKQNCKSLI